MNSTQLLVSKEQLAVIAWAAELAINSGRINKNEALDTLVRIQNDIDHILSTSPEVPSEDEPSDLEEVSEKTKSEREKWIEGLEDAIKSGLPKSTRNKVEYTIKGIQRSIKYGGTGRMRDHVDQMKFRVRKLETSSHKKDMLISKLTEALNKINEERYTTLPDDLPIDVSIKRTKMIQRMRNIAMDTLMEVDNG